MLDVVVDRESRAVFELEEQEDHWLHYVFFGDVGDGELHAVLHATDLEGVAGLLGLEEDFLAGLYGFLVVGNEKIVVDLLIEVKIGEGVLIGRLILQHLLQFLDIQLTDGIQVLINLSHDDFLLLAQRLPLSDAFGEGELDCLVEVFLNYLKAELPSACLIGIRGGMFIWFIYDCVIIMIY